MRDGDQLSVGFVRSLNEEGKAASAAGGYVRWVIFWSLGDEKANGTESTTPKRHVLRQSHITYPVLDARQLTPA